MSKARHSKGLREITKEKLRRVESFSVDRINPMSRSSTVIKRALAANFPFARLDKINDNPNPVNLPKTTTYRIRKNGTYKKALSMRAPSGLSQLARFVICTRRKLRHHAIMSKTQGKGMRVDNAKWDLTSKIKC